MLHQEQGIVSIGLFSDPSAPSTQALILQTKSVNQKAYEEWRVLQKIDELNKR